jgi:hypothetical protein
LYESSANVNGTVVPSVKPSPPQGVTAVLQNTKIQLKWTAPSDNYTTESYRVWKNDETSSKAVLLADASSCFIEGLTNGTPYKVSIERVASGLVSNVTEINNQIPFGLPILGTVSVVTVNSKKQVQVIVEPNGSALKDFFAFAAPAVYNVNNILLHKSSPLGGQSAITGSVTLVSSDLDISGDLTGALCIITNAAGASNKQQGF